MAKQKNPKVGNRDYIDAMLLIRRSNATTPVPSGKRYKRKAKHARKAWD